MNGRDKRRKRAERAQAAEAKKWLCANCLGKGRHFVPPSMGEPGFFTCEPRYSIRDYQLPPLNLRTVDYRGRGG